MCKQICCEVHYRYRHPVQQQECATDNELIYIYIQNCYATGKIPSLPTGFSGWALTSSCDWKWNWVWLKWYISCRSWMSTQRASEIRQEFMDEQHTHAHNLRTGFIERGPDIHLLSPRCLWGQDLAWLIAISFEPRARFRRLIQHFSALEITKWFTVKS